MNRFLGTSLSWAGPSTAIMAFLAAACCVLPMVFVALGLGGAWLSVLDMPLFYRTELQVLSLLLLGLGWAVFLWRQRHRLLATRRLDRRGQRTFIVLVIGSLIVAASFAVWEYQGWIRAMLMEVRD